VSDRIVHLVDDDEAIRRSAGFMLKTSGYKVSAYPSGVELLKEGKDLPPGCILLDVRMPGLSGLDLQHELQAANALLPIIFITGHGDIPMSVKAMKEGAVDFLPKPVKDKVLLNAIEQALERAAREREVHDEIDDIRRRLDTLTPRELDVLRLVITGMLNKQIAYELGTVEKTIKVHRARLMEKMEVQSLAELVRIAERIGIGRTT